MVTASPAAGLRRSSAVPAVDSGEWLEAGSGRMHLRGIVAVRYAHANVPAGIDMRNGPFHIAALVRSCG